MLYYYCILLITFLRFSSTDNSTNPICGSLSGDIDFSEITVNSYFDSLVQICDGVQEIPKKDCELLEAVPGQYVRQSEGSHSSSLAGPTFFPTIKVNDLSVSAQAGPSTSSWSHESYKKEISEYQCHLKDCRASFSRFENFCNHLSGHNKLGVYRCYWPKCGTLLNGYHQLNCHYTIHSEYRTLFRCLQCGESFVLQAALRQHCVNVHEKQGSHFPLSA